MENKINIAKLLKDCPSGMELDCAMYDKVILVGVDNNSLFPIKVRRKDGCLFTLTKYGQCCDSDYAKCVIFPKGKKTWVGFHRPFVEGDIVSTESGMYIGIVKSTEDDHECRIFCSVHGKKDFHVGKELYFSRLATEEEKQLLFDAIKDNGYKWNPETKTLEKLPKFKVGDRVKKKDSNEDIVLITDIADNYYIVETKYGMEVTISMSIQNNYELVPDKFDINTLKPFDKVLYRMHHKDIWLADFYNVCIKNKIFVIGLSAVPHCIPYEGNEHLLGTTNDCDDFYKTWE